MGSNKGFWSFFVIIKSLFLGYVKPSLSDLLSKYFLVYQAVSPGQRRCVVSNEVNVLGSSFSQQSGLSRNRFFRAKNLSGPKSQAPTAPSHCLW